MSITDNEEFIQAVNDYKHPYRNNAYIEFSSADVETAFNHGGEKAETILTAQHDKEMEEFEIWKSENAFMTFYNGIDRWMIIHKGRISNLSFAELLALFRNRK